MIRLFNVYFPGRTLILAAGEAVVIVFALVAAVATWLGSGAALSAESGIFWRIGLVGLICMVCMYYYDLYDSAVLRSLREALTRLLQVLGSACVILAAVFYLAPTLRVAPGPLFTWIILAGIGVACWRQLFTALNRSESWGQRTLLLGGGPLVGALATEIRTRPELGLRLVGTVGISGGLPGAPSIGAMEDLTELVARERIGCVVLTMDDRRGNLPMEDLLRIKAAGIEVVEAMKLFEAVSGRIPLEALRPSWLLLSDGFHVSRRMHIYKRAASLALAVPATILALPFIAIVALIIRLDSPGPAIFRQRRVGRAGKVFWLYKFRSMIHEVDGHGGPRPAQAEDKRFTSAGRILRKLRLDELPQIYNILRGDMCFIGPRPFAQEMEQELAQQIPFYRQRWSITPGATGWAQVQRGYCETLDDNIDKLSYDLFYIKNMSVGLDLLILFQTAKILLLGRGSR